MHLHIVEGGGGGGGNPAATPRSLTLKSEKWLNQLAKCQEQRLRIRCEQWSSRLLGGGGGGVLRDLNQKGIKK